MSKDIPALNGLRAARAHLEAQVEAGVDTTHGTLEEAKTLLATVNERIAEYEARLRNDPEAAYLFRRGTRRNSTGRTHVLPPQCAKNESTPHDNKEATMASKSKQAQYDETVAALKKAEKVAGSTKWALSGKGAEKNPPSKERKAHLTEKLAREQALIAELRAERDALKPKKPAKVAAAA